MKETHVQNKPEAGIRCSNCQRWRLASDVFWHVEDQCFYCQDVQACEYRYYIQGEREAASYLDEESS